MKKNKPTKLGQALIHSLNEGIQWEQGKIDLRVTDIELPSEPPEMNKKTIKRIRENILKISQPVLAKYLGVSDKAVKAWEQGLSKPNGCAIRLFQIALLQPNTFRELIITAAKKIA